MVRKLLRAFPTRAVALRDASHAMALIAGRRPERRG
jgi:hypothetical protein